MGDWSSLGGGKSDASTQNVGCVELAARHVSRMPDAPPPIGELLDTALEGRSGLFNQLIDVPGPVLIPR